MKLKVEVCDNNNLSKIWKTCSELAMNMSFPSFFCTGEWLSAAVNNRLHKNNLLILLINDDNNIIGLLPLEKKINYLGGTDLYYLGHNYYPDPVGLICSSSDRVECAEAIKRFLLITPFWDRLIIDYVLEDELSDWNLPGRKITIAPFKKLPSHFSTILEEFTAKKRYNLRSQVKKVYEEGGLLVKSSSAYEKKVLLEELFFLHELRSGEVRRNSTFTGENIKKFHHKIASLSDFVNLYGIKLNDKFISIIYGFEFKGVLFYYQVAHDPEYNHLSPGTVLLYLVLEDCCLRGVKELNFLQGNESYKSVWTKDSRVLYRLFWSSQSWRARVLNRTEFCIDYFKKCLRPSRSNNS